MKRILLTATAIAALALPARAMNVDDILDLCDAGFESDRIARIVEAAGLDEPLTARDWERIKEEGCGDEVVDALLDVFVPEEEPVDDYGSAGYDGQATVNVYGGWGNGWYGGLGYGWYSPYWSISAFVWDYDPWYNTWYDPWYGYGWYRPVYWGHHGYHHHNYWYAHYDPYYYYGHNYHHGNYYERHRTAERGARRGTISSATRNSRYASVKTSAARQRTTATAVSKRDYRGTTQEVRTTTVGRRIDGSTRRVTTRSTTTGRTTVGSDNTVRTKRGTGATTQRRVTTGSESKSSVTKRRSTGTERESTSTRRSTTKSRSGSKTKPGDAAVRSQSGESKSSRKATTKTRKRKSGDPQSQVQSSQRSRTSSGTSTRRSGTVSKRSSGQSSGGTARSQTSTASRSSGSSRSGSSSSGSRSGRPRGDQ